MFSTKIKGRKEETDYRSERVVVHVTEKEKKKLKEISKKYGMDPSSFIRARCIYNKFNSIFGDVE